MTSDKFRFRKHSSIGASAAEEDENYLKECFIDTGDLSVLMDCANPKRIILGRTGSGKTALLNFLAEKENAIIIRPESLSFGYLANSTILQFFLNLGVKLDLFFRLLWKHVFTVELLKKRYKITNERAKTAFLDRFSRIVARDKKKERAISYLRKWGESFWEETEYRIKEITRSIEDELRASLGSKLKIVGMDLSDSSKLNIEEKAEIIERGKNIINSIQMRELTDILDFLNEDVFDDEKSKYYICIDKLDENWIDDRFRYLLIRSLIETQRDFVRVKNIKIIVVLRSDLIERVFRFTRDAGFQEEKYRSMYLQLNWTDGHLRDLLDKRINYLVKQTYTKKPVGFKDIMPKEINGTSSIDYMIKRTLMRPRDLIEYFNLCAEQAVDRPTITKNMLLSAEGIYSRDRLRSLQDEWYADYPTLSDFIFLLRKKPFRFDFNDFDSNEVEEFCLRYVVEHVGQSDSLSLCAKHVAEGNANYTFFLSMLLHVFYKTGICGLKTETYESFQWVSEGPTTIASQTICNTTKISIHPMFWKVLGVAAVSRD